MRQRLSSGGGRIYLHVDASPFDLTVPERRLIFDLVDALRGYNADHFGLPLALSDTEEPGE